MHESRPSAGSYWNDYPTVRREIDRRISGDPNTLYRDYFHRLVGGRRFERALFVGCGDGNVARGFVQMKIVDTGVGIDVSGSAIAAAKGATQRLPISYEQLDLETGALPEGRFDLVVSNGASHRFFYVDRVFRTACRLLTSDGFLVNYDYVGPHRYQYPAQQWTACERVNAQLAPAARRALGYPGIEAMLRDDPAAGVHSELLRETAARYFTTEAFRPAGGAIAYPLLTFNDALPALPADEAEQAVGDILLADLAYSYEHPGSAMFAFWYGRPKHDVLRNADQLARWQRDEDKRESRARRNGGRYYPPTPIEAALHPAAVAR